MAILEFDTTSDAPEHVLIVKPHPKAVRALVEVTAYAKSPANPVTSALIKKTVALELVGGLWIPDGAGLEQRVGDSQILVGVGQGAPGTLNVAFLAACGAPLVHWGASYAVTDFFG